MRIVAMGHDRKPIARRKEQDSHEACAKQSDIEQVRARGASASARNGDRVWRDYMAACGFLSVRDCLIHPWDSLARESPGLHVAATIYFGADIVQDRCQPKGHFSGTIAKPSSLKLSGGYRERRWAATSVVGLERSTFLRSTGPLSRLPVSDSRRITA